MVVILVFRSGVQRRINIHPSESRWWRLASVAIVPKIPKIPKHIWRANSVELEVVDMGGLHEAM
jgi:hypothetical protein